MYEIECSYPDEESEIYNDHSHILDIKRQPIFKGNRN